MNYLITGCGYLTKALIKKLLLNKDIEKIKIFSRNEKEQWKTKILFNDSRLDFIIGDIRDFQAINTALQNVDYCIHTGAIKRIEVAEKQPMEAIKTNVIGSMNVINAAIANKIKKLILISTDKATSATTCYGSTKFLMECMAYANESTRFFMPVSACVDIILHALELGKNGELWVYRSKSCTIKDLADAFSDNQIITGTENIEKNDEALITINELNHSKKCYNYYVIHKNYTSEYIYSEPLTSYTAERLTKKEIKQMIKEWRTSNEI